MEALLKNYLNLSTQKQELIKVLLKEQGIDINDKIILSQKRVSNIFPMSYAQKRLWFLEKLEPESPLYIIPSGVKITGKVYSEYFVYAINEIVKRHEILRTRFIEKEGEGFQEILNELIIQPIHYDLTINENLNNLEEILAKEFKKPFKLSDCPLFRLVIIHVSDDQNYILLPMHHIISDNWSTGILIKELIEFYNHKAFNSELKLDDIKVQYADYSIWQMEWMTGSEIKKQKEFWIKHLENSNDILGIIPDKKRPSLQSYNGSHELFIIDDKISKSLIEFCKKSDNTTFIVFLSVYQFILSKYAYQSDINVGVPIANRNRSETENIIGFFINTLVFRGKINDNDTVKEFINSTKKYSIQAYANQDVPFEMIVDELNFQRDMSHTALFQAMMVLNNAPMSKLEIDDLIIEPIEFDTGKSKFDLVLSLTPEHGSFKAKFEFNTDVYNRETIKSLISSFVFVLKEFLSNPNKRIKDIKLADLREPKNDFEKNKVPVFEKNNQKFLHQKFENNASNYPNKIAISDGKKSITYSELNNMANRIASELLKNGLHVEESVGIYMDRRIEFIASVLGILKAGGVFISLDTDYPQNRIDFIVNDSKIKYVIALSSDKNDKISSISSIIYIDSISTKVKSNNPVVKIDDRNSAYIVYTSGSTGQPKGVVVEHSKIANHIDQMIIDFEVSDTDKYLQFAAFNFDASIEQIFVPLIAGSQVYLRGNEYWLPSDFFKLIKSEDITIINPPTIYWNQLVSEIRNSEKIDLGKLKLVIVGGEEMHVEQLSIWKDKVDHKIKLINAYGPTETVITSAIFKTDQKKIENSVLHVPIGTCIGQRTIYIIDPHGNLVPKRMPGELCFGGDLLAKGYVNEPALTAEKFTPDLYSGAIGGRIYKTGDLVRYSSDGCLEYLGRIDNQVKVRGFRIELSEIENILNSDKNVKNSIVAIDSTNKENSKICAFIIPYTNDDLLKDRLLKLCKEQMPSYMVPNQIVLIDKIPLNANGKLDKKQLPFPNDYQVFQTDNFIAPRTDLEKELSEILCNILSVKKIGINSSFFDLGGNSILAIKLISKVREIFGVEVPLINLFKNSTLLGLSEAVIEEQAKLFKDDELESLLDELENI